MQAVGRRRRRGAAFPLLTLGTWQENYFLLGKSGVRVGGIHDAFWMFCHDKGGVCYSGRQINQGEGKQQARYSCLSCASQTSTCTESRLQDDAKEMTANPDGPPPDLVVQDHKLSAKECPGKRQQLLRDWRQQVASCIFRQPSRDKQLLRCIRRLSKQISGKRRTGAPQGWKFHPLFPWSIVHSPLIQSRPHDV